MLSVPLLINGKQIGEMQITRLQPLDPNREWYDYEWVAHFPPVRGVGRASGGRILHRRIDTAWVLVQKAFTAMCGDLPEGWNEPAMMPNSADPDDESTWRKPCWNCGHVPGCEWQDEMGYACCPSCRAD